MPTLSDFFNLQADSETWVKDITQGENFSATQTLIASDLSDYDTPASFYEPLFAKLTDALDLDLGKILVGGWKKHREVVSYRDKTSPGEGYHEVTLTEHTIESTHNPTIQPVIGDLELPELQFDITLELNIEGVLLYIREARIMKAAPGLCTGSGTIEFKENKLLEKETKTFKLPGEFIFDPAIKI